MRKQTYQSLTQAQVQLDLKITSTIRFPND
jgi:hypothetical protein